MGDDLARTPPDALSSLIANINMLRDAGVPVFHGPEALEKLCFDVIRASYFMLKAEFPNSGHIFPYEIRSPTSIDWVVEWDDLNLGDYELFYRTTEYKRGNKENNSESKVVVKPASTSPQLIPPEVILARWKLLQTILPEAFKHDPRGVMILSWYAKMMYPDHFI